MNDTTSAASGSDDDAPDTPDATSDDAGIDDLELSDPVLAAPRDRGSAALEEDDESDEDDDSDDEDDEDDSDDEDDEDDDDDASDEDDEPEPDDSDDDEEDQPQPPAARGFAALGLNSKLLEALSDLGYDEPTPIQREAIPPVLAGNDLLGQAATGTGKTAAFALPVLEQLAQRNQGRNRGDTAMALILTPTRELAMQVSEAIESYGSRFGARVVPVYGGQPIGKQLGALRHGVDVVVATPGRAIDHINRRSLVLDDVSIVVMDEADEMLDMGFAEDLEAILEAVPDPHQTLLFSATMPPRIAGLAKRHLSDPTHITIAREVVAEGEAPRVSQTVYYVRRNDKAAALARILDVEVPEAAIVFCRTRTEVDELTEALNGRGYRAEGLHGGMSQEQRDRVMGRVRATTADLLIATDVAARGLDIDHLTHVVNFDVPAAPEQYVHRIGRVGRAGREGTAITIAEPRQQRFIKNIERVTKQHVTIGQIPTVAQLRTRRKELTIEKIRAELVEHLYEDYRSIVDSLSDEFDVADIAAAAVRAAHEALGSTHPENEEEIHNVEMRSERRPAGNDRFRKGTDRTLRGPGERRGFDSKRGDRRGFDRDGERPGDRPVQPGYSRIWVSAGRRNGVRPGDLVGAICGETSLRGNQIGAIRITENFSLVEVPSGNADEVIRKLGDTTIKGRRTSVRRDKGPRRD